MCMASKQPGVSAPAPQPPLTVQALGTQLRALRKQQKLTLESLAARANVSAGIMSQVERGQGNPSFNTLVQIAHALSIPVAQLFRGERTTSPVVRHDERRRLSIHRSAGDDLAIPELLTPGLDHALEALMIVAPPGYSTESTPFSHDGEEFGIILEGTHEVHLGGVCYTLECGDAITYSSRLPHWYRNPTDQIVRSIWVITPPTF